MDNRSNNIKPIIQEDYDAKCDTMAILLQENYKRFTTSTASAYINSTLTAHIQTNNQENSPEYPKNLESKRVKIDGGDAEINAMVKENNEKANKSTISDIQPRLTVDNTQTNNPENLPECPVDIESMKGRVSWELIESFQVPYITRSINGEHLKFTSIRLVESLLTNYLKYLHIDIIHTCVSMMMYSITVDEAKLLNDIIRNHKNLFCTHKKFSVEKDHIVHLEDVQEFYSFIKICHSTLMGKKKGRRGKFGYIRIDSGSVIPYYIKNNQKFVPIFFLEEIPEQMENECLIIEKWDLAYLKLCFLIQGIRKDTFASSSCSLINLESIKNYFPTETYFEDFWPHRNFYSHLFIRKKNKSSSRGNSSSASNSGTNQAVYSYSRFCKKYF